MQRYCEHNKCIEQSWDIVISKYCGVWGMLWGCAKWWYDEGVFLGKHKMCFDYNCFSARGYALCITTYKPEIREIVFIQRSRMERMKAEGFNTKLYEYSAGPKLLRAD